jgi:hypothetical protein
MHGAKRHRQSFPACRIYVPIYAGMNCAPCSWTQKSVVSAFESRKASILRADPVHEGPPDRQSLGASTNR